MSTSHSHEKVHVFLKSNPTGVLSTVASDGRPWGSAIYFVSDDDFTCYFVTRAGTAKYQNLLDNPFVALTIVDAQTQVTVQIAGKITPLPIHDYMEVVFDKLAKLRPEDDNNWAPPINKVHEGNFMPLKLTPTKLQFADFGRQSDDHDAQYITTIIPDSASK